MFTWILKNDWFKKKATFAQSGKVEMISTFQRNRHLRKVLVNKTFTHVQEQKKRCRGDIALTFRLISLTFCLKSPLRRFYTRCFRLVAFFLNQSFLCIHVHKVSHYNMVYSQSTTEMKWLCTSTCITWNIKNAFS